MQVKASGMGPVLFSARPAVDVPRFAGRKDAGFGDFGDDNDALDRRVRKLAFSASPKAGSGTSAGWGRKSWNGLKVAFDKLIHTKTGLLLLGAILGGTAVEYQHYPEENIVQEVGQAGANMVTSAVDLGKGVWTVGEDLVNKLG